MYRPLRRLLSRSLVAGLPALALVIAFAPAAGARTAAVASQQARAAAAARALLQRLTVGWHATDHSTGRATHGISGLTQVQSTNWSGYADTGSGFSKATGSWSEPSVSCTSTTSYAAFWVGIDGFSSGSVEQDGTLAECSGGRAFYFSWWEMFPSNAIQVVGQSVSPGDAISASVVRSSTSYTLRLTDSTHPANSFSTTQSCSSCANSSAEWIAEAPSSSSGVLPLADFHTWTESGATVTAGSTSGVISTFPDDEITMIDSSGLVKAQPGALNSSGNGFSVTWVRST
jgi:peptidase A4-like protein